MAYGPTQQPKPTEFKSLAPTWNVYHLPERYMLAEQHTLSVLPRRMDTVKQLQMQQRIITILITECQHANACTACYCYGLSVCRSNAGTVSK